ncbi:Coenzyme PQQ synthesis protein B [Roseovarius sp. EC-HK134]|uniref:pyrroloquinoline quinone biosynthesis protein PqqB n=1 Tax=unclassified Roseovarius TaxID=2614913 RepID=UPI001255956A|nr:MULTISPECIES: pyrroloquinoline quinone biosynthesis protein PqqB [unclassified Roseovarius]VVT06196.1 Coenzyme PQQ synthesis protein B [Roseovarius sp. EC-SD190]VVT06376.1 Coenzyme PQQ synthesis protein B [Roseovarius sp. EC-HK134]
MFKALILGAAAGGGLPQWNCGCENCNLARDGKIPASTQSSLAVTTDGVRWVVLNASPDIRAQLAANPALHPRSLRDTPIAGVLLTNGDIDHVAGLLSLREQQPFTLYATGEIHGVLADNPLMQAVDPARVPRVPIALNQPLPLLPGLTATLFAVPGKVPLYLEGETVQTDLEGEQTTGVHLEAEGRNIFYIPGCAAVTDRLAARLRGADMVFFDGTLWRDDEMITMGLSQKTGRRMGHISMSGPDGSIAALRDLGIGRKIYVHMNNSNPVLRPDASERAEAESAGWTIGQDGMEITA